MRCCERSHSITAHASSCRLYRRVCHRGGETGVERLSMVPEFHSCKLRMQGLELKLLNTLNLKLRRVSLVVSTFQKENHHIWFSGMSFLELWSQHGSDWKSKLYAKTATPDPVPVSTPSQGTWDDNEAMEAAAPLSVSPSSPPFPQLRRRGAHPPGDEDCWDQTWLPRDAFE